MAYDSWADALAALVRRKGLENTELGEISRRALEARLPTYKTKDSDDASDLTQERRGGGS